MQTSPCLDCPDRWVRDGHSCHETCERYKVAVEADRKRKKKPASPVAGYVKDKRTQAMRALRSKHKL